MEQYIKKSAVVVEIEKIYDEDYKFLPSDIVEGVQDFKDDVLRNIDTLEVKEIDLELITHWFDHIAQIADDRKTANGTVMEDWAALDEIKCLAKNSSEFIKMHYKAQKGE